MSDVMKISGIEFHVDPIYAEGHVLTAIEANALNQARQENLRNNYAPKVRKAIEDAQAGGAVVDAAALQAEFAEYQANYSFGTRRERGENTANDPVFKEAFRIAKELVKAQLKAKEFNLKKVGGDKINELAMEMVKTRPAIMEQARVSLEAKDALAKALAE